MSDTPPPTDVLGHGAEPTHAFVRGFALVVLEGPDAGVVHRSRGARVTVGRGDAADLRLTDPSVSLFHCELEVVDGRPVVRDLQSRNGTLLDGVAIREAYPTPGAVVTIGQSKLRLELGAGQVPVPLAAGERFGTMVGRSAAMRAMFAVLARAATSDATVLLEGETGTGKEAAAESVHAASARHAGPFVVVDCGAIPPNLLESELFGHERGAFTGAVGERRGAFEEAEGGTVFLDEIGELAPELQPKLLRVLERKEIKRVGSNRYQPVDCRLIAATSRNLRAEVNERRFRADLYYRLAVVQVHTPALRERREDLSLLVEHFLGQLRAGATPEAAALRGPELRAHLERHAWPGNVRELRNYVERCVALGEVATIATSVASDGAELDLSQPLRVVRERCLRRVERQYLEALLRACDDNVSAAARRAGVDRPSFYRLLWRTGLR